MNGSEQKRQRTQQSLKSALGALCESKPYVEISVGDICDAAHVDRSTFYRYYTSKDELLRQIEDDYIRGLERLTPAIRSFVDAGGPESDTLWRREMTADLNYHLAHRKLAEFLLSPDGDPYFRRHYILALKELWTGSMEKQTASANAQSEYAMDFFICGYLGLVEQWVRKQDRTVDEVVDFLMTMLHNISGIGTTSQFHVVSSLFNK